MIEGFKALSKEITFENKTGITGELYFHQRIHYYNQEFNRYISSKFYNLYYFFMLECLYLELSPLMNTLDKKKLSYIREDINSLFRRFEIGRSNPEEFLYPRYGKKISIITMWNDLQQFMVDKNLIINQTEVRRK